ncbi:hypothetical protein LUZ61_012699 [Rhynchospora tenuis]|uniref:RING-type E3 ubiquitin transferase n=1 Tax=Rhynchospora tenuis TaxID=198213 RepID=A0AAD6A3E3_9POAL|nr:hypothetical protein LUZ61_012699 [Rhynchospora tenuis]
MEFDSDHSRDPPPRMDRHLSVGYHRLAKYYWFFIGAIAVAALIFVFASNFLKTASSSGIIISAVIVILYLSLAYFCRPRHPARDGSGYLLPMVGSPLVQSETSSMRYEASELCRIIDSIIPAFLYSRKTGEDSSCASSPRQVICSVCLALLIEGEQVRQLPQCKHIFHAECIATWLPMHMSCPICRSDVDMRKYGQAAEGSKSLEVTETSAPSHYCL